MDDARSRVNIHVVQRTNIELGDPKYSLYPMRTGHYIFACYMLILYYFYIGTKNICIMNINNYLYFIYYFLSLNVVT